MCQVDTSYNDDYINKCPRDRGNPMLQKIEAQGAARTGNHLRGAGACGYMNLPIEEF